MPFTPNKVTSLLFAATTAAASALVGCGDVADPRPAVWEYISPAILQPNCATVSCHSRAAAVAGLDFSDPERGYTSLTGLKVWIVDPSKVPENGCARVNDTVACQRNFRPLVTPYVPSQSRLVHMLRARNADRMPPDRPLPEADIALVERWILEGARKNMGVTVVVGDAAPGATSPTFDAGAADTPSGN